MMLTMRMTLTRINVMVLTQSKAEMYISESQDLVFSLEGVTLLTEGFCKMCGYRLTMVHHRLDTVV